ncbi:MAG TPA: hypothetical protein VFY93_19475 [Planctomycetota bacterium]|nr:hypothetical protein [Planctomycetota bacterium]
MEAPVEAVAELRRIYAEADAEAASDPRLRCELSGRCCRFREAGHVLYVTRLEFEEMVRSGGAGAGEEGTCPWLRGTLCGNREGRALACRTYFCSDEAAAAALTERLHARIRELHVRYGIPYDYRPLHDHH